MKSLTVKLAGTSPLLMHSDRYANPLDPMTKAHKVLTKKRNKTDDDYEVIAKSEWLGSLYYDETSGPYLPTQNIRSCLVAGGKLRKLGAAIQRGTIILDDKSTLIYDGPKDIDELFEAGFVDCRSVVVSRARLMRYRPIFKQWAVETTISFDENVLDAEQIVQSLTDAGNLIGLGDFRPAKGGQFGRFSVAVV